MNRFKTSTNSFLENEFWHATLLLNEKYKTINPHTEKIDAESGIRKEGSLPLEIVNRRYQQLRDAWHENQPTNFQNIFEVNTYCSEALSYVTKLERLLEGVKTMYREHWYREQYKTVSKHGFHALLAGTHSIFVLYWFVRAILFLVFFVAIGFAGLHYIDNGYFSKSDMGFLVTMFCIIIGLKTMEFILYTVFGKNHQQIIKDKIRQSDVMEGCYPTHLITISQEAKKLRDDIEFFQRQWEYKLKNE